MPNNPYDDLIAAPGEVAAAGPATNPYDDLIVDEQARQQTQMRANVTLAADTNPEAIASQRQLAKYVGFKPAIGEAIPDEVKRLATVKKVADDTAGQPVLQKAYTEADFARIGHDDSGALKSVGTAVEFLGKSTFSGALGLNAALFKLLDAINPFTIDEGQAAALYKNDPDAFKRWQDGAAGTLNRVAKNQQAGSEFVSGTLSDDAQRAYGQLSYGTLEQDKSAWRSPVKIVGDALQSLPTSIALGLSAYLSRGASMEAAAAAEAAGLSGAAVRAAATEAGARAMAKIGAVSEGAAGYAQQALQTASDSEKVKDSELAQSEPYQRLIKEGFHPITAKALVVANAAEQSGQIAGIVDAAVNAVGGRILGKIIGEGGNAFMAGGKGLLTEAITEGIQSPGEQFGQNWAQQLNVNPNQDLSEGVLESALQGMAVGGFTGGAFSAAAARGARHSAAVEQAQAQTEKLQDLFKSALDSKLRERDPVSFANLVQQMAEATPGAPANVYIDAHALTEALDANPEAAGVFNQMPQEVRDQVQEAMAVGGAVEIPLGELTARGAGTALETALLPHLRTSLDGLSQTEAKEATSKAATYLQQEADRVIAESENGEAIAASADKVHSTVLEQLNAINRNTPDVNQTYATLIKSFYTATSERLGMTPEEMLAKYPLKIKGETVGEVLNAKGSDGHRSTKEISSLFNSMVKGAEGELRDALFNWNESELNEDKDKIVRFPGRDSKFSRGKEGGKLVAGKAEFINWLAGDGPMDRSVYGSSVDDPNWQKSIQKLRGIINPKAATQVLNQDDAKVHNLTSVAERGERIVGTRASFSAAEKEAVKASAEKTGVSEKEITAAVRGHKLAHPMSQGWAPLTFVNAKIEVDDKGKSKVVYNYQNTPYSFSSDSDGKQIDPESPAYKKRVNAVAKAMVDEVRRVFQRAATGDQNAKNILAQAGWYKAMRARLRQEFGGLGDLFADLLGATSPNTPVRDNWTNAVDTLRRASRGDYDALLPKWVEWADKVDALELDLRGWFNERIAEGEPFVVPYGNGVAGTCGEVDVFTEIYR